MIKVGIVDDHSIIIAGFRELIMNEASGEMMVCFEARNAQETYDALEKHSCDVLLLDISLPGKSGIDILQEIREAYTALKILILSIYPEDSYASALIRQGADGYLSKNCEASQFIHAIRTVASGKRYLSSELAHKLAGELATNKEQLPHELLSDRELQVFLSLAKGETVTAIASELNLSVKTISTYRARLLEKLGAQSNAELATYAVRNHLI